MAAAGNDYDRLADFQLVDSSPNIENAVSTIEYNMSSNFLHFADRVGFPEADFVREQAAIGELDQVLETGQEYINLLYTFRSCGRAIPTVTEANKEHKEEIHRKIFDVLRPEIVKLVELKAFVEHVIKLFCQNMQVMVPAGKKKKVLPEGLFDRLIRVVDLLVKLDNLKDMKACLQNDFSSYKRAFHYVRSHRADGEQLDKEINDLQMFLADPMHPKSLILHNLKTAIRKIRGHESVQLDLIEYCKDMIEKRLQLLPDDKHRPIRALPHLLLLLDHKGADEGQEFNVFKDKRLKLAPLVRIIQQWPVVPTFGDMIITSKFIMQRCPNYDSGSHDSVWGVDLRGSRVAAQYSLSTNWTKLRDAYDAYTARYTKLINDLRAFPRSAAAAAAVGGGGAAAGGAGGEGGAGAKAAPSAAPTAVDEDVAACVFDTVLEGLQLLSLATSKVLCQSAWKYATPQTREKCESLGADLQSDGIEYERVVRFNYSQEDQSVLIDYITMIKSLAGLLRRGEGTLGPILRIAIHQETQRFVQKTLGDILHRLDKKKKVRTKESLLKARGLAADWLNGVVPFEDYKAKKKDRERRKLEFPTREVGPSATQLMLLRTAIRAVYDDNAEGMQGGGLFSSKDFDEKQLALMRRFYNRSAYYHDLLHYSAACRSASDLGDLWYREFYLEMTHCVQFPIRMSLPWIITEHVVQQPTANLLSEILYAMDVYNDAAHRALHVLGQQFIYDEIEAEVNLVFDQLIVLICDTLYRYHKDVAAGTLLDKPYRARLEALRRSKRSKRGGGGGGGRHGGGRGEGLVPDRQGYNILMAQRHVQLLGRSIDLNYLLSQRVNAMMRMDLEACLLRFEGSDVCGLVELMNVLQVLEATHKLLAAELEIDPWSELFAELNETVSPSIIRGRVGMHVLTSLINDLLPNFAFNFDTRRFVRSPRGMDHAHNPPRNKHDALLFGGRCAKAYDQHHKLDRSFFGEQHAAALVSLLDPGELHLILEQVVLDIEAKVTQVCAPIVQTLMPGLMPTKLPKYQFRSGMAYAFFEAKLKNLLEYDDLKPAVFQSFRELGNALSFLHLVETAMQRADALGFLQSAAFLGATPMDLDAGEPEADEQELPAAISGGGAAAAIDGGADGPFVAQMRQFAAAAAAAEGMVSSAAALAGIVPAAERAQQVYAKRVGREPVLQAALRKVRDVMDRNGLTQAWRGEGPGAPQPPNGVMGVEVTSEFYRLWSALQFLFCIADGPPVDVDSFEGQPLSDMLEFGDGFTLAGCVFVHLLRQRKRFELLDYTYHLLRIHEHEEMVAVVTEADAKLKKGRKSNQIGRVDDTIQGNVNAFVRVGSAVRMLNDKLFSMLERYAPNDVDHVLVLHPPDDDDEAKLGTGALLHTMEMTTRPASKSIGRGGGGGGGYQGGAAGGSPQMHAAAAAAVPPVQESKQPAPEPAAALPPPAPAPPPRAAAPAPLPPNWQEVPANDGTGDFYFWNEATNETSWDRPTA